MNPPADSPRLRVSLLRVVLLYSVAGESGIGIAELKQDQSDNHRIELETTNLISSTYD
ncbi:MAG: hypothetical protein AAB676_13245 [Verrucomicrobiota bacterium]